MGLLSLKFFKIHLYCAMSQYFIPFYYGIPIVWIDYIIFTLLSVYGHLSCFNFLAIMNNETVSICV